MSVELYIYVSRAQQSPIFFPHVTKTPCKGVLNMIRNVDPYQQQNNNDDDESNYIRLKQRQLANTRSPTTVKNSSVNINGQAPTKQQLNSNFMITNHNQTTEQ